MNLLKLSLWITVALATPPACFLGCINDLSQSCPRKQTDVPCLCQMFSALESCIAVRCKGVAYMSSRDHFKGTCAEHHHEAVNIPQATKGPRTDPGNTHPTERSRAKHEALDALLADSEELEHELKELNQEHEPHKDLESESDSDSDDEHPPEVAAHKPSGYHQKQAATGWKKPDVDPYARPKAPSIRSPVMQHRRRPRRTANGRI